MVAIIEEFHCNAKCGLDYAAVQMLFSVTAYTVPQLLCHNNFIVLAVSPSAHCRALFIRITLDTIRTN